MQPSQFTDLFKAAGFSDVQADTLVGVFTQFTQTQRVFDYRQPFPAVDPDCVTAFTRSFHHQDWVDGESVVQAEQTSAEDGFNVRFHRIEQDLDALSVDLAKVFLCLGEMRGDLRALLDEIKAELNRINSDLFALKGGAAPPPLPLPTHNLHDIVITDGHDVIVTHDIIHETHIPPVHDVGDIHIAPHNVGDTHPVTHDVVDTHLPHDISHSLHGV